MSFSITIASVIISLQKKQEILGFYAIGFSAKDLIQPFYVFALFLTFCTYTEAEYAAKYWVKKEDTMHSVGHAFLPDDSRMIFQKSAEGLHDIFWIRSSREVWHLDSLQLSASDALGKNVTQFKKTSVFEKADYFNEVSLPSYFQKITPYANYPADGSIFSLLQVIKMLKQIPFSDIAKYTTSFYYKLVSPWFFHILVTFMLPFLVRFPFNRSIFVVYFTSFGFFFLFQMFMECLKTLAENYLGPIFFYLVIIPTLLQTLLLFRLKNPLQLLEKAKM